MRQWNQSEAAKNQADDSSSDDGHSCNSSSYRENGVADENDRHSEVEDPMMDEHVSHRLSAFAEIRSSVPKGTFVIHKEDVMKPDCALWKVDNQNLLQKYPLVEGVAQAQCPTACYRNSSTVSRPPN